MDAIGDQVYAKRENDDHLFVPDSILLKAQSTPESGTAPPTTSKAGDKKAQYLFRQKQRQKVQETYPVYDEKKKTKDLFVFYSLHVDGVSTSLKGSGRTYEVVSLQILNTNDANRSNGNFCCYVAVIPREKGVKTKDQEYIGCLHAIVQETVISGLLGRYYYYNNTYYHVRWGILCISGDTKAEEELMGYPAKQMTRNLSLFDGQRRLLLNPMTKSYTASNNHIFTNGSSLSFPESVWNCLHPLSWHRFWNVVDNGSAADIRDLKDKADEQGKKDIELLILLKSKIGKDNGWKPVPFHHSMAAPIEYNQLVDSLRWAESKNELKQIVDSAARRLTVDSRMTAPAPLTPQIASLRDVLSEAGLTPTSVNWETDGSALSELFTSVDGDDPMKDFLTKLRDYVAHSYDVKSDGPQYQPLDIHLPLPPGFAYVVDVMHLIGNACSQFFRFLCNDCNDRTKELKAKGFDDYAMEMRGGYSAEYSCFLVPRCYINRAVVNMAEYQKRHPTYIPWFHPGMLLSSNMSDLKTEYKFQIVFGFAHYAFKDYCNESPIADMLACFDGLSYLATTFTDINEAACVQARLDFFLGKLCNGVYPGFETPTVTNMTALFESILRCGALWILSNFRAEGSYNKIVKNLLNGRNPCKTLFKRLHGLMVTTMFLYWSKIRDGVLVPPDPGTSSDSAFTRSVPSALLSSTIGECNFLDDYRFFLDDSLVYDDAFYGMLDGDDPVLQLQEKRSACGLTCVVETDPTVWSSITWNGTTYHSMSEKTTEETSDGRLSINLLEYSKESLAFTLDRRGNIVLLAIVGYLKTSVDGMPFPEAIGILVPTTPFSLVSRRCHRCFVMTDDPIFGPDPSYRFVRASLNRLHIDTALPFPYNNGNLMIYTGCLVLRPECEIKASTLFFPKVSNPYVVNPRRSSIKRQECTQMVTLPKTTVDGYKEEIARMREELKRYKH